MIRSLITKKFPAARLALTVGLGGSLLALNANAQTADTGTPDRIIVTGSNIPTAAEVGGARVDTVDQDARDRTGQQDVLSVLTQADPSFSGGGNVGQSNASVFSGSTYGGSSISIHGLPTLVLLNGRRVADSAAEAANGNAFVDVNLFPAALIKRIEVLKDGASAIYGSEAIGGVVNIILDQDFRGFEVEGRYGFTEKSDIKDKRVSAIVGIGDDKTSIVIGGEYTEQDPIFTRDRTWAEGNDTVTGTYPGNITLDGHFYHLAPGLTSPLQVVAPGSLSSAAALIASGAYIGPLTTRQAEAYFDYTGPQSSSAITLDQNRTNLFGEFSREIWSDHIIAYGEFLYSHNYSQSYLNAQPITGTATAASFNYPGTSNDSVIIPVGSPTNPFNFQVDFPTAAGAGANGQVFVRARFLDFPRIFRNDTDFYRVVAGLKGSIMKSIDLSYDISFNTSQNEINYRNSNLVIASNLNSAVANGTVDLFSTANQDAALTAAGVFGADFRDLKSVLNVFQAGITAFPFKLPAGPVGIAAGYEYRFEKFRFNDSPEIFLFATPQPELNVGRDIDAAYTEVSIPVVSPTMKIPGVYSFDVDGAVRMEKYENIHSSFVPKVSLVYRPIEDIALRGSFSKSFIAPTLLEEYGPSGSGASSPVDVLGTGDQEQANVQTFSNPKLDPSTADTYSVGIVLSPKQVPGLTISGDFFHVEQKNEVGSYPAFTVLQSVNKLGAASPYASLVALDNFPGLAGSTPITAPGQIAGAGFNNVDNTYINEPNVNVGLTRIGGVDFGLDYKRDFGKFGALDLGLNGVYYLQSKQELGPGLKAFDLVGLYTGEGGDQTPSYRLAPYIEYAFGGFKASALGNYIPSTRNADGVNGVDFTTYQGPGRPAVGEFGAGQGYFPKIRDYYTINLLFSYTFGLNKPQAAPMTAPAPKDAKDGGKQVVSKETAKQMSTSFNLLDGLSLGFGINNVTNAKPPFIGNSPDSTNTDNNIYDPYQRLYYFTIAKKF